MIRVGDVVLRRGRRSTRGRGGRGRSCSRAAAPGLLAPRRANRAATAARSTGCSLRRRRPGRCCSTRSARAWSNWRAETVTDLLSRAPGAGGRECRAGVEAPRGGRARRPETSAPATLPADARDEPPAGRGVHRRAGAGSARGPLRRRSRRHHDVFDPRRRSWLRAALGPGRRHCDADPLPRDRGADRSRDGAGPGGPDPRALRCAHGVRDDDDPDRREPRHDRGGVRRHRVGSRPRRRPPHRQRPDRGGRHLVARDRLPVQAHRARSADPRRDTRRLRAGRCARRPGLVGSRARRRRAVALARTCRRARDHRDGRARRSLPGASRSSSPMPSTSGSARKTSRSSGWTWSPGR